MPTFTSNLNLTQIEDGESGYVATWAATLALIDALAALGALAVATTEVPSASLNVKVSAGKFRKATGATVTYAGTSSQAMTASTTNYVFLTDTGTLTVNTTGFPVNAVPLATVVAGTTTITSVADARVPWAPVGVGTPTIAGGTGAGTSPTISISGTDRAGLITLLTGSSPATSATVATVTFGHAFGSAPMAVFLAPASSTAAALSGNGQVWPDAAGVSTTVFTLNSGSTALAAATTYKWSYRVEG